MGFEIVDVDVDAVQLVDGQMDRWIDGQMDRWMYSREVDVQRGRCIEKRQVGRSGGGRMMYDM